MGGLIGIEAIDVDNFRPRVPVSIGAQGEYSIAGLPHGDYELQTMSLMAPHGEDGFRLVSERFQPIVIRIREEGMTARDLEWQPVEN